MFLARTDWNALGALAGIGSLGLLLLTLLGRVVMNAVLAEVRKVATQVTPSNGSTLAGTVERFERKLAHHSEIDDARFHELWRHLGIPESEITRR